MILSNHKQSLSDKTSHSQKTEVSGVIIMNNRAAYNKAWKLAHPEQVKAHNKNMNLYIVSG